MGLFWASVGVISLLCNGEMDTNAVTRRWSDQRRSLYVLRPKAQICQTEEFE